MPTQLAVTATPVIAVLHATVRFVSLFGVYEGSSMAKDSRLLQVVDPPVDRAVVFVCEKCGKRADYGRNPSHELASRIKRLAKRDLDKRDVRSVLTSCLKLCPEDRIAVTLVSTAAHTGPVFFEADYDDVDATAHAVIDAIQRTTKKHDTALS